MEKFVCLAPNVYRLAVTFPGCWAGAVLVMGEENILIDTVILFPPFGNWGLA